ncbi:MAG: DUF4249 domain-containing protein [Salinivirgaceae bacterium]
MRNSIYLLLILVFCLSSCEEPFVPEIDAQGGFLVFEGQLTDQQDVHSVRISRSVSYNESSVFESVSGFTVRVEDENGQQFPFSETSKGLYQSIAFKGLYNYQYRLLAISPEGKTYASDWETLLQGAPVEQISGIYYMNQWLERIEGQGYVEHNDPGLKLLVSGNYSSYTPFYRYEYQAIFQTTQTYPTIPFSTTYYIARPFNSLSKGFVQVLNGNLFQNQKVEDYPIDFITKAVMTMHIQLDSVELDSVGDRIYPTSQIHYAQHGAIFRLNQYSLNERAFKFWDAIYKQQEASGQLFDPVETQIVGNIKCTSDTTEQVFGYFTASAICTRISHLYLSYNNQVIVTPADSFPTISTTQAALQKFPFWVN